MKDLPYWRACYREATALQKTAQGSVRRPEIFTPSLTRNIAAMSAEKYFMALFARRGLLPHGHTLTDLSAEARSFIPISEGLVSSLRRLDGLELLCPFAPVRADETTAGERDEYLATLSELASLARDDLEEPVGSDRTGWGESGDGA